MPIGRSARQWIEEYQKQSRIHLAKAGKSQDYLFLNIRGTNLTRDMIRKLVEKYSLASRNWKESSSTHIPTFVRYTFARRRR